MPELFKDKEHLVRVALLFIAGLVVFLIFRAIMVPEGFGEYGHYRVGALEDNRNKPISFAGHQACVPCHEDVVEARKGSAHEGVHCESCHGPQAAHAGADDPGKAKPKRPDAKSVCLVCHMANVAKPAKFPQVDPKEHGEGEACATCHLPHHPELSGKPVPAAAPPAPGSEVTP